MDPHHADFNHPHPIHPLTTLSQLSTTPLQILTIIIILLLTHRILDLIQTDYHAFLSLGPGGTPSNPLGYLRIKFLSLFATQTPYLPLPFPATLEAGQLPKLSPRPGARPTVRGIAPHRQTTQKAPAPVFALLAARLAALARAHPATLLQRTSCLEKHGPGLFALRPRIATPRCAGEICHAHPSDGSLHLTLHPRDAACVLRAGWGERHPLGGGGWLKRFVPGGFLMVYAPRDEAEVKRVLEIVKAAAWWVGGVDLREEPGREESGGDVTGGRAGGRGTPVVNAKEDCVWTGGRYRDARI